MTSTHPRTVAAMELVGDFQRFRRDPHGGPEVVRVVDAAVGLVGDEPANQFVAIAEGFDLEYAGPVIRIWCQACDKHEGLPDDEDATVEAARAEHRCGERTSPWHVGEIGVRS